ncbi:DUF1353 domain-containing protein [Kribbella endophytica]
MPIHREPERFFDGGPIGDNEPIWDPISKMKVVLERTEEKAGHRFLWFTWERPKEMFKLTQRITYRARIDGNDEITVSVPADGETFRTDLTSVPTLFTWLIPRTGSHLPAALVHDGLVFNADESQSYLSRDGRSVTRMQADEIFRDAMADLGTSAPRRWIMWAAVTLATIKAGAWTKALVGEEAGRLGSVEPNHLKNAYYRLAAYGSLLYIVMLGILSSLDFLDWRHVTLPVLGDRRIPVVGDVTPHDLPIIGDLRESFMGDRPWQTEFWHGALAALILPVLLAVLWWRLWKAGLIVGVALALLLYVTLVLAALTLLFQLIELLCSPVRGLPGRQPANPPPATEAGPASGQA